jgi:hypothetical protein
MKDRLGFDPDELMHSEVDDLFCFGPDDDDFESPSHKKFKAYKPSPSSSTSSMLTYESALKDVKGKQNTRVMTEARFMLRAKPMIIVVVVVVA